MTPAEENERLLAHLCGIDESEATMRLQQMIRITFGSIGESFANELRAQLERTVHVSFDEGPCQMEIVVYAKARCASAATLFVQWSDLGFKVGSDGEPINDASSHPMHGLLQIICASYTASLALRKTLGTLPGVPDVDSISFDYSSLGFNPELLKKTLLLQGDALAGAGAVGNGFLRALRHIKTTGTLSIVDPKTVGDGNPNRCLYFTDADVGKNKAVALCANAQDDFSALTLVPIESTFHDFVKVRQRVERVIVGVDSPRVRRSIQSELPLEVVDASTTDISEIILHSNKHPTTGACLSCIYKHTSDEFARERDIADGLGISIEDVAKGIIDADIAEKILQTHPNLSGKNFVGVAMDSLFKRLCGEAKLSTTKALAQALAPFAFIPSLAGALLALELLRTDGVENPLRNYFFLSPWSPPTERMRSWRNRDPECEFCSKPQHLACMEDLWKRNALR